MTNGFDRLERFFNSRRKTSPGSIESVSPTTQVSEPQFPSPSFIRPKTSRMTAREEVRFRSINDRSPSVPDITSVRLGSSFSRGSGPLVSSFATRFPVRSPSFTGQCLEPLIMELNEFQFPSPPSRSGELTPMSMASGCLPPEIPQPPSPRSRSPIRATTSHRLDIPPSEPRHERVLPRIKIPYHNLPTPRESPQLAPVPGSGSGSSLAGSNLDLTQSRSDDFRDQLNSAFARSSRSGSCSDSSLESSHRLTCYSTTLREPDFNDFLNLSDDDIAESTTSDIDSPRCPGDGLEPFLPTMDLSISSSRPCELSLLTLTPPRASRPAESGAIMAARIAKRFDFDLIYIVNLWPGNRKCHVLGNELELTERPLVGRLLAAHGLQHVPSPLQISSLVHSAILGSDGWIEYRNAAARPNELARGYARAFYTGRYAKSGPGERRPSASSLRSSHKVDRGIVFAAYRKPRYDDANLDFGFTEEQLDRLHVEAEILVNFLLDIHAQSRGQRPSSGRRLSDETGPIPFH